MRPRGRPCRTRIGAYLVSGAVESDGSHQLTFGRGVGADYAREMTGNAADYRKSGAGKGRDLDAAIDGAAGGAGVGGERLTGTVRLGHQSLGWNPLADEVGPDRLDSETREATRIGFGPRARSVG